MYFLLLDQCIIKLSLERIFDVIMKYNSGIYIYLFKEKKSENFQYQNDYNK